MLKEYNFKKEPILSPDHQETTIQTEDFHKIMRLANSSLNCSCSASMETAKITTTTESGLSGLDHHHYHDQRQFITNPQVQNYPGSEPQSIQTQLSVLLSLEPQFGCEKLRLATNTTASPLSFLSSRLSQFTKATKLFSTRD